MVDGFARLGPFLTPQECDHLRDTFDEIMTNCDVPVGDEWFPTILLQNEEARAGLSRVLAGILGPKLDTVFHGDQWDEVRLDFSVKPPTERSELGPHQDYSMVDEDRFASLYVWVPLIDTSFGNGTLHVVRGSHRFANKIRSRTVPALFDDVLPAVRDAGTRLDCVAGELIIMVAGVIHFSPPNLSGHLRLAAHGVFTPRGAPLVHYLVDADTPTGSVECFEVEGIDRFVRLIHDGRPDDLGSPQRIMPLPPARMTAERLAAGLDAVQQ